MRYHYDCYIWVPGQPGMSFCWNNKLRAIAECKKLLALNFELGHRPQRARVSKRKWGVVKFSQSKPRLPVIWQGKTGEFRLYARRA